MRILMVCLGNICRSPIAEGVLRSRVALAGLDWQIDSAGTNSYHTGEPPHRYSQAICLANGIDISSQRARTFTAADFENYDRIYALADDVYRDIMRIGGPHAKTGKVAFFLDELTPGAKASVPDPWYGNEDGYAPVFKLISETCDAIIERHTKK